MNIPTIISWIVLFVVTVVGVVILLRFMLIRLVDKRIASFQSNLIQKHFNEIQNIYTQMRGWRHDYHNQIQTMKVLLSQHKLEALEHYFNTLNADLNTVDVVIKTGNIMVDAILNSKLSMMQSLKIQTNVKAVVPADLKISEVDLCVILGNLLDNAIEACLPADHENININKDTHHDETDKVLEKPEITETIEDVHNNADTSQTKKFIRIYIGKHKSMFYISVSNSVDGVPLKKGNRYFSLKKSSNHGFGLMRIDRVVAKNGGTVNRQNEAGVFATEVLLPV